MHISLSMRPKAAAASQLTKSPVSRTRSSFNPLVMVIATANLVRGHKVADVNVRKLGDAKQVDDLAQRARATLR